MNRVQFLKDTSTCILPEESDRKTTLVLFREGYGYELPSLPSAEFLEIERYKSVYSKINPELIIIIGANRIINPSNRCEFVFEHLQTSTPHIPKFSIDKSPFIGEPWRLWYHYSFANCGNFKINYSYALETEWKRWFYREAESDKLSGGAIQDYIDSTYSDLSTLFTSFSFYDPDDALSKWYLKVKSEVFLKYDTPKLLISNLLKHINNKLNLKLSFDSYLSNESIRLPDFGVCRFVAEENIRRLKLYNGVIKYGGRA